MDPPLIHEASFSTANPSSYTLSGIWPFGAIEGGGVNLVGGERDGSVEESTVTEQSVGGGGGKKRRRDLSSEDETSKIASTTTTTTSCSGNELDESNNKGIKPSVSRNENSSSKADAETSSAGNNKASGSTGKPSDPPKQDYIHVRARRGQATDSHSLAERARREKISERMKILQDLVPGCNKVIGKALVLDEIINYIQSLQCQVEFLSMKLETVNSRMNLSPTTEGFHPKDLGTSPVDVTTMMFGPQVTREYVQGSQPEWLHMQIGGSFERAT